MGSGGTSATAARASVADFDLTQGSVSPELPQPSTSDKIYQYFSDCSGVLGKKLIAVPDMGTTAWTIGSSMWL